MALVSPQQVSDGTSIVASNVNNPINTIANDYNGNITDANISASAAIAGTKIATASVPTTSLINDWQTNYVVSGGVIAVSSGLVGTFSNCTVVIDGYKLTLSSVGNKTYTASKDTYVDILRTGTTPSIVYTEVANNAASPALASNSIRVGIVVSSGVALTVLNQGQSSATGPTVSSNVLTVCDSLGNMIYNTNPNPTVIGYRAILSSTSTASGTAVQITGLSCPVIIPAGRKAEVVFFGRTQLNNLAGGFAGVSIWDGTVGSGTMLARTYSGSATVANINTPSSVAAPPQQPSLTTNTSKTYNMGMEALSGGTTTLAAASNEPYFVEVRLV